jgi:transcription elongation factor S-II
MRDRDLVDAINLAAVDAGEEPGEKKAPKPTTEDKSPLKKRKQRDEDKPFEVDAEDSPVDEDFDSEEDNKPPKKKAKKSTPDKPAKKETKPKEKKEEKKTEKKVEKTPKKEEKKPVAKKVEKTPPAKKIEEPAKKPTEAKKVAPIAPKKKKPTALTNDELQKCSEAINKAIDEKNNANIEKYVKFLQDEAIITIDQLKAIKIGTTVNKLRKHEVPIIAQISNQLISKWKQMVTADDEPAQTKQDAKKTPEKKTIQPIQPIKPVSVKPTSPPPETEKPAVKSPAQSPKLRAKQEFKNTVAIPPPTDNSGRVSPPTPSTPAANSNPDFEQKIPQTKDKTRDWGRKKLALGLLTGTQDEDKAISLGVAIENALLEHYSSSESKEYKGQLKSIGFNLADKNNKDFCDMVLSGEYTPQQLVTMESKLMASKEMQDERKRLLDERIAESTTHEPKPIKSSLYRCGKCKQNQCSYYQMQTRSADEPMTTFVTCHNCGNRWKC